PGVSESDCLRAAATCQVFIPLLAPTYPNSPACAMEWDRFAGRATFRRADHQPTNRAAILPVIWQPASALPSSIAQVAPFVRENVPDQSYVVRYHPGGLAALQPADPPAYELIVYKLAL